MGRFHPNFKWNWCFIFKIYDRTLRHRNIQKHGYPPEHCDVDGDFLKNEEKEEDDK